MLSLTAQRPQESYCSKKKKYWEIHERWQHVKKFVTFKSHFNKYSIKIIGCSSDALLTGGLLFLASTEETASESNKDSSRLAQLLKVIHTQDKNSNDKIKEVENTNTYLLPLWPTHLPQQRSDTKHNQITGLIRKIHFTITLRDLITSLIHVLWLYIQHLKDSVKLWLDKK